jgi:serine/threonine protein kinase
VVKVLDFGLAKLAGGVLSADREGAPTMTAPQTVEGSILGTPRYMSPEQARGQVLDKRTDIWSFGCVVYEPFTGQAAFAGATLSDTLAAVLSRDPDWSALPESTPAPVQALLRRCLEKDRKRRLRDIGDAGMELEAALTTPFDPTGDGSCRPGGPSGRCGRAMEGEALGRRGR